LVAPAIYAVTVYASMDDWKTFTEGDVLDEQLGIRIPISELFE
jgi:hypothetical protein